MEDKKVYSYSFLTLFAVQSIIDDSDTNMGNSVSHLQTTVSDKTFRNDLFSKPLNHLNKIETIELTLDFIVYQESGQNENDAIDLKYNDNDGNRFEMSHEVLAGNGGGIKTNISNNNSQSGYSDPDGAPGGGKKSASTRLAANSTSSNLGAKFQSYLSAGDGTQKEFADSMESKEEQQQGNNETVSQDDHDKYNKYNNNNMRKSNNKHNATNEVATHNKGGNGNEYKTKHKNHVNGRLICLACCYDGEFNNRYKNSGKDNNIGVPDKFTAYCYCCGFLNCLLSILCGLCVFSSESSGNYRTVPQNSQEISASFGKLDLNGNPYDFPAIESTAAESFVNHNDDNEKKDENENEFGFDMEIKMGTYGIYDKGYLHC